MRRTRSRTRIRDMCAHRCTLDAHAACGYVASVLTTREHGSDLRTPRASLSFSQIIRTSVGLPSLVYPLLACVCPRWAVPGASAGAMAGAECSLLFGVDDGPALGRVLLSDHEPRVPLAEQRSQLLLSRGRDRACRVKGGGIGALEVVSSSARGGGWQPAGQGSLLTVPSQPKPPGAPRGDLARHCRGGSSHAAGRIFCGLSFGSHISSPGRELE